MLASLSIGEIETAIVGLFVLTATAAGLWSFVRYITRDDDQVARSGPPRVLLERPLGRPLAPGTVVIVNGTAHRLLLAAPSGSTELTLVPDRDEPVVRAIAPANRAVVGEITDELPVDASSWAGW